MSASKTARTLKQFIILVREEHDWAVRWEGDAGTVENHLKAAIYQHGEHNVNVYQHVPYLVKTTVSVPPLQLADPH